MMFLHAAAPVNVGREPVYRYHMAMPGEPEPELPENVSWAASVWYPPTAMAVRNVILARVYRLCNGLDSVHVHMRSHQRDDAVKMLFLTDYYVFDGEKYVLSNEDAVSMAAGRFADLTAARDLSGTSFGHFCLTLSGRASMERALTDEQAQLLQDLVHEMGVHVYWTIKDEACGQEMDRLCDRMEAMEVIRVLDAVEFIRQASVLTASVVDETSHVFFSGSFGHMWGCLPQERGPL